MEMEEHYSVLSYFLVVKLLPMHTFFIKFFFLMLECKTVMIDDQTIHINRSNLAI